MALVQVANVATLPGIVRVAFAMPDVHWGYGFPIGDVAATDIDDGGVVSRGGVGFDISCGVRLLVNRELAPADLGGNRRPRPPPPRPTKQAARRRDVESTARLHFPARWARLSVARGFARDDADERDTPSSRLTGSTPAHPASSAQAAIYARSLIFCAIVAA